MSIKLDLLALSQRIGQALRDDAGPNGDDPISYPSAVRLLGDLEDKLGDLANSITESYTEFADGKRFPESTLSGKPNGYLPARLAALRESQADTDSEAEYWQETNDDSDDDSPANHERGCHCDDCTYERAASRARSNDFEDTDGKDWT